MGQFKDIALPMAARGIPVTPVRPNSKAAFLEGWQQSATTDPAVINEWDIRFPDHNAACVAKAEVGQTWFFEVDSPEVRQRIKAETGHDMPETFVVRSRPGRGHYYFKSTPASINMGNIAQGPGIKHGDWSARVDNQYVVAPGSIHPTTGLRYEALGDNPIVEAPEWLIYWLLSQRVNAPAPKQEAPKQELIPHGQIHGYMLREAGKLRNLGLDAEEIYPALSALVHKNCQPPLDESKIRTMAKSICNFPAGASTDLIMTQQAVQEAKTAQVMPPTIDDSPEAGRPSFPHWVMRHTALYECLVEPAVATSSKYPEFIFMPAMQMFLNYLSGKIMVGGSTPIMNMFLGLISPPGQYFKSSSCGLAHDFFHYMGMSTLVVRDTKAAEGKVIIGQAGSPEGFGVMMQKINANNAILYNGELEKFASKAGIESSSFSSDLLEWYEAGPFGNTTLNAKNKFQFEPKKYCFGWQWCTTERSFNRHWPKIAGMSSGLEDRMFFVVSPKDPRPTTPYMDPDFSKTAMKMKMVVDKAMTKKQFQFEDFGAFADRVKGMDPRSMTLVQNLAVAFAILLEYDTIEDDSIERALALVDYRNRATRFLEPIEADNLQGRLQKEIIRELRQNSGRMRHRDLERNLDIKRYGMDVWNRAYKTMLPQGNDEGTIMEWREETTPGKRATRMVGLIKHED